MPVLVGGVSRSVPFLRAECSYIAQVQNGDKLYRNFDYIIALLTASPNMSSLPTHLTGCLTWISVRAWSDYDADRWIGGTKKKSPRSRGVIHRVRGRFPALQIRSIVSCSVNVSAASVPRASNARARCWTEVTAGPAG